MSITRHFYKVCFPYITSRDISTPAFSSPAVTLANSVSPGHIQAYPGRPPFALKIALHARGSGLPSNEWFRGHTRVRDPNGNSIGSPVFAQVKAESTYIIQWVALYRSLNYPFACEIWTPSATYFPGPTRGNVPNGITIGSAAFTARCILVQSGIAIVILSVCLSAMFVSPIEKT